jgi:epoxyqueuosine reductase QueG
MEESRLGRREFLWLAALGMCPAELPGLQAFGSADSTPPEPGEEGRLALALDVIEFARGEGLAYLGVGDMAAALPPLDAGPDGGGLTHSWPRVVSLACRIPDELVDALPGNVAEYARQVCTVLRPRVDDAAKHLCELLASKGYGAVSSPSEAPALRQVAGHLAGLGWIGRNGLLVTPGVGPRVVPAAVLTDAPLPVTCTTPMQSRCGDCQLCLEACPSGALNAPEPGAEACFDGETCAAWCAARTDMAQARACGMCVKVCPYGNLGRVLIGKERGASESA